MQNSQHLYITQLKKIEQKEIFIQLNVFSSIIKSCLKGIANILLAIKRKNRHKMYTHMFGNFTGFHKQT